jgi:hypothetical protein
MGVLIIERVIANRIPPGRKNQNEQAMKDFLYLNRWRRAPNYIGHEWPEWFVVLGRHRDSDILTNSNFECVLKALGGESETIRVIRESHWAVGWVEWLGIHESSEATLDLAESILDGLDGYPVFDEQDYSRRELDAANDFWESLSLRQRVKWYGKYLVSKWEARRPLCNVNDRLFDRIRDIVNE